jgi:hypothetical protein
MATKEEQARAASLCPADMDESNLLDNIRCTWKGCCFEMTDYGGKSQLKRPAFKATLEEPGGTEHDDQWWSAGKVEEWSPSDDGQLLLAVGGKTRIHKKSNFGLLMQSLLDNGYPADKFTTEAGGFDGLECQMMQVDSGRGEREGKDGKKYADTVLVVSEIFKFPWEKGKAKSGGAKGSTQTAKGKAGAGAVGKGKDDDSGGGKADAETVDIETQLQLIIAEALLDKPKIAKNMLPATIMIIGKRKKVDPKSTQAMIQLSAKDEYLSRDDHPWEFDGAELTLPGSDE